MECQINKKVKQLNSLLSEVDNLYQALLMSKNISDSEFMVMVAILTLGEGCLQKEIARNSHVSKKTINSAIKKLQKEGYIELKAGKYPNLHIYLTDKGNLHIQENILPIIEVESKVLNDIPSGEFDNLITNYKKYIDNFRNYVTAFTESKKV